MPLGPLGPLGLRARGCERGDRYIYRDERERERDNDNRVNSCKNYTPPVPWGVFCEGTEVTVRTASNGSERVW